MENPRLWARRLSIGGALCVSTAIPAFALNINLNDTSGMNAVQTAGFEEAAAFWESMLGDGIDVNLDVGFGTFTSPLVLGAASSNSAVYAVGGTGSVFSALATDAS